MEKKVLRALITTFGIRAPEALSRREQEHSQVRLARPFKHRGLGGTNESETTHLEVAEIQDDSHNHRPSKPHLPPARENNTSEILKSNTAKVSAIT